MNQTTACAAAPAAAIAPAQPVAFYRDCVYGNGTTQREYNRVNDFSDGGDGIPLYAAPQPSQPVEAGKAEGDTQC